MPWNIAQAKQHFSQIVRQTTQGPQLIYNRKRLVAAVIDAEEYRAFKEWSARDSQRTLASELADLRQILREEDYEFTLPSRSTRASEFVDQLEEEQSIARRGGELRGQLAARGIVRQQADMLIAATAQAYQLTLVTRNTRDYEQCGIGLLNPFHDNGR